MIQPLIPKVLVLVKNLIVSNLAKAANLMEIWEELLETEVSLLAPHLKAVAELCLEIASKKDLDDSIRIRALNFISTLARLKKKVNLSLIYFFNIFSVVSFSYLI